MQKLLLLLQMDLVVATPKRLSHLVKAKQVDLASVQFLILDEADKLFEQGFVSYIDRIILACSKPDIVSLLTLCCSACMLLLACHYKLSHLLLLGMHVVASLTL